MLAGGVESGEHRRAVGDVGRESEETFRIPGEIGRFDRS